MKLVALFLLLGAVSGKSVLSNNDLNEYWKEFKRVYEKSYSTSDEHDRRKIWEKNVEGIIQHNLEADMGKHTYLQGLNEYSDMDYSEVLSKMTFLRSDVSRTNRSLWIPPSNVTIPDRVDWRNEELITPVQEQGGSLAASTCGSGNFPCGTGDCPCGTGACPCGSRAECPWGSSAACPGGSSAAFPFRSWDWCPCGRSSSCPCGSPRCPCGSSECRCGQSSSCYCGSSGCPCGSSDCRCGQSSSCYCGSYGCPCGSSECQCGQSSSCYCGSSNWCPCGSAACPWGQSSSCYWRSLTARKQQLTENYQFVGKGVGSNCTGFVDIPSGDEEALKQAVATVGPISAAIDSTGPGFGSYKNGVYDEPTCRTDVQNHSVLIVGYGTLDGVDYWLVKNSWGETWGLKGYIMMTRNKNNQCGIATKASYPLA